MVFRAMKRGSEIDLSSSVAMPGIGRRRSAEQMSAVHPGGPFQLILKDGRTADVYIDLHPSNRAGVTTAEFHICGALIDTKHRPRRLGT